MAGLGNGFSCSAMRPHGAIGKGCGGSPVGFFFGFFAKHLQVEGRSNLGSWWLFPCQALCSTASRRASEGAARNGMSSRGAKLRQDLMEEQRSHKQDVLFERFSLAASVALQRLGTAAANYLTTTHCTPSVRQPLHMDGALLSHLSRGAHWKRLSAKQQDKLNQKHSFGTQGENAHQL